MQETCSVILKIPKGRVGCENWIKSQPPDTVADVLSMSESVYNSVKQSAGADTVVREQNKVKEKMFQDKFNGYKELMQSQLKEKDEQMEMMRTQYSSTIKKRESELITEHELEVKRVYEQYSKQLEINKRLEGDSAIFKENVRKEFSKDSEIRFAEVEKRHNLEVRMLKAQLETESHRNEENRVYMRQKLEEKEKELKSAYEDGAKVLQEKTNEITSVIRNITGSTATVGKFGENFVSEVHAQMELGTYRDDSHIKQSGFADGTWELKFPSADIENLVCLVDVKYGFPNKMETHLHSQKDIKKFEDDTRAGVNMGRINCSMLISLVRRVQGKPRVSMDTSLGVPTVWISRGADDAIPAKSLVEMGFLVLAQSWPIISKKHSITDTVQAIARNLECQMIEYEKMEKHIHKMEDNAQLQLRNVCEMRKIQSTLIQNIHSFRIRYPAIVSLPEGDSEEDFWEKEGMELINSIKHHKATKGRNRYYPKTIEELNLNEKILNAARNIPHAFEIAKGKVKDEMQDAKRTHSKKQKTDDA